MLYPALHSLLLLQVPLLVQPISLALPPPLSFALSSSPHTPPSPPSSKAFLGNRQAEKRSFELRTQPCSRRRRLSATIEEEAKQARRGENCAFLSLSLSLSLSLPSHVRTYLSTACTERLPPSLFPTNSFSLSHPVFPPAGLHAAIMTDPPFALPKPRLELEEK